MSNKTTALDWLEDNLIGNPHSEEDFKHNRNIWEWAKAMEKEQIIDAHGSKNRGGFKSNGEFFLDILTGEQYYNETYKHQKKGNKCFECNNDKGNNELYCSFCRNQN